MNYDKLTIKKLFNTRDTSLLAKVKPEMFKYNMAKSTVKLLKNYVQKFGVVPTIETFEALLHENMDKEKADIFSNYLKGLQNIEAEATETELLEGLKAQYILTKVDSSIEELVTASSDRNIDTVKELIKELSSTLNTHEKSPEDISELDFVAENIRTINPFLPSMRQVGIKLAGLNLIGARTGGFKSTFTLTQAMYSYKVEKLNVCYLNLELSFNDTIIRAYCTDTGTSMSDVYGVTDKKTEERINAWKNNYFNQDNRFTIKNTNFDEQEISEIILVEASKGTTVFFIDYLTLVESTDNREDWKVLTKLVRHLHALTQKLGIVIITPVQVNVEDAKEVEGEIRVSTRGSKELENSATNFFFLYQNSEEFKENVVRLFSIKTRNGAKKTYVLNVDGAKQQLEDTGIIL